MSHLWSGSGAAFLTSLALGTLVAHATEYRALEGSELLVGCLVCDSAPTPLTGTFDLTVALDALPAGVTFDLTSIQFDAGGQSITGTGAYWIGYLSLAPITQTMDLVLSIDGQSPIMLATARGDLPSLVDGNPILPRIDLVLALTDPLPQEPTDPDVSLRLIAEPVPEPATLGLLAVGLALAYRRRFAMKRG